MLPMPTGIGSLLYTTRFQNVNIFLGGPQVFASYVLFQRLPEQRADNEADDHVDDHIAAVIQSRVEPRRGHGQAEKLRRHIFGPHCRADDVVYEKSCAGADDGADEEAVFLLAEGSGDAQNGEGQNIVADDGLPAPCVCSVEQELQYAGRWL